MPGLMVSLQNQDCQDVQQLVSFLSEWTQAQPGDPFTESRALKIDWLLQFHIAILLWDEFNTLRIHMILLSPRSVTQTRSSYN